jgi:hypothetical protein
MGVTNGGIHWLDGLLYLGLIFGVYAIYRLCIAWMDHREVQKMLDTKDDDIYNWKDEDGWE